MKRSQRRYRISIALTSLVIIGWIPFVGLAMRFLPSDAGLACFVLTFLFGPAVMSGFIAREKGIRGARLIGPIFLGFLFSLFAVGYFLWMPYSVVRQVALDEGMKVPDDRELGRFRRVCYYIGDSAAYSGDLFITVDVIHYVPMVDILESRIKLVNAASGVIIQSLGKYTGTVEGTEITKSLAPLPSFSFRPDVNAPGGSQANAVEAVVEALKLHQPFDLPGPIRVGSAEIRNFQLHGGRTLSFDTVYERYEFKVRVLDRRRLREALENSTYWKQSDERTG